MKTLNKGFAPIAVILIIVAVLVVGGGMYFVGKSNSTTPSVQSETSDYNFPVTQNQNTQTTHTTTTQTPTNTTPSQNAPTQTQAACNSGTPMWIKVLSPNGGQTFTAGQQVTVTWSKCNTPANSSMLLLLKSNQGASIGAGMGSYPNTGSATVTIPSVNSSSAPLSSGNYYKIRAMLSGVGVVNDPIDESDNTFTINNPIPPSVSTTISSQYIAGTQWPPTVTSSATAYACTPSNGETHVVIQKVINSKTYCITSDIDHASGGQAGGDYVYTRANGSGTKSATFQLRWHYCDVNSLTSSQYNQCQTDQASVFGNLDAMVDSLM